VFLKTKQKSSIWIEHSILLIREHNFDSNKTSVKLARDDAIG
jgi:hypothetical protein